MTFIYEKLLKPVFFLQEPEAIHDRMVRLGRILGAIPPARWTISLLYGYKNEKLRQTIAGIPFDNPVGLAAGFDKDCKLMKIMPSVGFGYAEVGSVTAEPYAGNPPPRAYRLVKDESLVVNYGLKNQGALTAKQRLAKRFRFPIGVSVAKTNKRFKNDEAKLKDWIKVITLMKDSGDYLTINLSCPNTWDTTNYCNPLRLKQLLVRIKKAKIVFRTPVFLKLNAELTPKQADAIIKLCKPEQWITGFVISNLVKDRAKLKLKSVEHGTYKGGLSGSVVKKKALALVRHFKKKGGKRFVLIACGGVFTAKDAYEYITAGASLVQLVTGMIYKGPGVIKEINKGLVALLEKDKFKNISQAGRG